MAVNFPPQAELPEIDGIKLSCVAAALRYRGRDDLLLVELTEGTTTSAVFTRNNFAAAPVIVAKQHLNSENPRALLVNMGNANAATGALGVENCRASCQIVGELLSLDSQQILPFSTGVIGEQLDMDALRAGIKKVTDNSGGSDWLAAAHAIKTTDTVAKAASRQLTLDGKTVTINGICKGSGMICPNMATMLAFVATDAAIAKPLLDELLQSAVATSFNRITVDSDTSTNDAVTLSATARAGTPLLSDRQDPLADEFYASLESLMIELATDIIRDGEGASKFIRVDVINGASEADCSAVAYALAHSPLVKTALFAGDPNWGRLPMAIGKADTQHVDADKVDIAVNGVPLMASGAAHPNYTEELGQQAFAAEEITILVDLNAGDCKYHVWTSDLSHEYVSINADYRS